jgi:sRNA-binding protein
MLLSALAVTALAAGCGGGGQDEEALRAGEIAQAKQEGARQARVEERQREQRREQRQLKRELARLKRERSASSSSRSAPAPAANAPAPARPAGESSCGGGLSVGPNTTCAFAQNVRREYASTGASTIEVFSPVTQQTYVMRCAGGVTTVCTGGNGASVYFR